MQVNEFSLYSVGDYVASLHKYFIRVSLPATKADFEPISHVFFDFPFTEDLIDTGLSVVTSLNFPS